MRYFEDAYTSGPERMGEGEGTVLRSRLRGTPEMAKSPLPAFLNVDRSFVLRID
jgi:hypothetical protein